MSGASTRILGRFVYQAEVLPARARSPRRIDLWAPAEYEIPTSAPDGVARDAVVVEPRLDSAGHTATPLHLTAHDGQLYSPMKGVQENGQVRNFAHLPALNVEGYLAQIADGFPRASACDDPILAAYDARAGNTLDRLPHPKTMREDDFAGEIIRSNRTESLARHQRAANDVLFVGDEVFVRRPEPTWTIGDPNQHFGADRLGGGIALSGLLSHNTQQRFRLDRLEEAIAFRKIAGPPSEAGSYGRIVTADFSLLRRDDLACMIADVLPANLQGLAAMAVPHFSAEERKAWFALSDLARPTWHGTFRDDRIALDPAEATRLLRTVAGALRNPSIPSHFDKYLRSAMADVGRLLRRAEFELAQRPAMDLADEDAISLLRAAP